MTKILQGTDIATSVKEEILHTIQELELQGHRRPSLHVILVGDDPASKIYIRNKVKACKTYGIESKRHNLPKESSEEDIVDLIHQLNQEDAVDGILLQLPLPKHLRNRENSILETIAPEKDVDGFHPVNIGKLVLGLDAPISCTPAGCIRLLEETKEDITGKIALVIGRSNTVGKPLIQLLLQKNATVIVCHSKTENLKELTLQADIIIAACGQAELLKGDMVKEGVIVIDVGINRQEDGSLLGDVEFDTVSEKSSFITPVPGGVGPMTIAMLLKNTLLCYRLRKKI